MSSLGAHAILLVFSQGGSFCVAKIANKRTRCFLLYTFLECFIMKNIKGFYEVKIIESSLQVS